jgi:hypothetical protein
MALQNENCTHIRIWKWIQKVYCINSMHRILQIVKVKQLQPPNAPLNPSLFTLQTDMSWHCTTLHEMHKLKSTFIQLACDTVSCTYPQIQVELLTCIVKFNNTVNSNHVVACHYCVTVLPSCRVTWALKMYLKPEFKHIFTYFFSWYAISIMYHGRWVSQPFSMNYYVSVFQVHMLATGLLRILLISIQL